MQEEAAEKIDAGQQRDTPGRRPGTLAVASVAAASIDTELRARLRG